MKNITFIPVGGLANRMRAMASAVTLAANSGSRLRMIWFRDWTLNASFRQLFNPFDESLGLLKDASRLDYLLYDRPRSKNLHLPLLFQKISHDACLYERSVSPLCNDSFDFVQWAKKRSVFMASYTAFLPYDYALINRLFDPVDSIKQEIDERCGNFTDYVVGVHIRRTDHSASILKSPIELFYDRLDKEIEQQDKTGIYLATDAEEIKSAMRKRYGNRVMSAGRKADRGSVEGVRDGVCDMYALARTQRLYGSFQSSFSEMASQIGGVPLEIVSL